MHGHLNVILFYISERVSRRAFPNTVLVRKHVVGFTIKIYHDARSPERQIILYI